MKSTTNRSIRSPRTRAAMVTLAAVSAFAGALSAQASTAATPSPPAFKVADGARLYVPASTPASGRAAAWVVFRTSPHVDARLTVVQVAKRSGRSYAASGAKNCVRSAVPAKAGRTAIKAGHRYRVSFYARAGTGRHSERRLVTTRELTATRFTPPTTRLSAPDC